MSMILAIMLILGMIVSFSLGVYFLIMSGKVN